MIETDKSLKKREIMNETAYVYGRERERRR